MTCYAIGVHAMPEETLAICGYGPKSRIADAVGVRRSVSGKVQNSFSNASLLRVSCRTAGSLREVVRHIGKMRFRGRSQNIL